MKTLLRRAALCASLVVMPAAHAETPPRYKINLPPPAELEYAIKARQKGIPLDGSATVRWHTSGSTFSIVTETRAQLLGKIMEARTDGAIDRYGLAPHAFKEKRFGKAPTTTTFDRSANTISFSSGSSSPIKGGEQDRNSIVWQLVGVARAAPARFKPGSEWAFVVTGRNDAETWTFKVVKAERVKTALGTMDTLQVTRMPPDGKGQQLDIWLAPKRGWYPVRLRFADDEDGDYIDQTLTRLDQKT